MPQRILGAVCLLLLGGLPAAAAEPAVVLVADGAGDYRGLSKAVTQAVAAAGLPLIVEPACWSHGYRRSLADQVDQAHARAEGRRLAERVLAYRTACPERPVYLLAHSAGAAVVLYAAAWLPPDSVDRILLLAPTVSAYADVRPALRCARAGVDVFTSCRDRCAWVVAFTQIGAEGHLLPRVAARVGFVPRGHGPEDALLYGKLRQYAWEPSWICLGHEGGHYGIYTPEFLRHCVLPRLEPAGD
jgi:pimeloyl-ACP methyl ester carboxylesterase